MIKIQPISDLKIIEDICKEVGITYSKLTRGATMIDGEERLGFSLFDINKGFAVIRWLEPANDLPLADGMLRSTIHIALEQQCASVYYDNTAPEAIFEQLGFILNKQSKQLNTHKLFESCCDCK